MDLSRSVANAHLGLLEELTTFSYGTAEFFHPSLSGTPTKVKFFSGQRLELNWGQGAVVYGYSLGSILLGQPEFQGGNFPPDLEVDKDLGAALRIEARDVPIGGAPVSGTMRLLLDGIPSEPVTLPVRVERSPSGTHVLRAGEGDHRIAEGEGVASM